MKTIGQTTEFKAFANNMDARITVSSTSRSNTYEWYENEFNDGEYCEIAVFDRGDAFGVSLKDLREKELKDGEEIEIYIPFY